MTKPMLLFSFVWVLFLIGVVVGFRAINLKLAPLTNQMRQSAVLSGEASNMQLAKGIAIPNETIDNQKQVVGADDHFEGNVRDSAFRDPVVLKWCNSIQMFIFRDDLPHEPQPPSAIVGRLYHLSSEMATYGGLYKPSGRPAYIPKPERHHSAHLGLQFRNGMEIECGKVIDNKHAAFKVSESAPLANRNPTKHEGEQRQKPIENNLPIVAICYEGACWTKLRICFGYILFGLAIVIGMGGWLVATVGYLLAGFAMILVGMTLICLSAIMTEPC